MPVVLLTSAFVPRLVLVCAGATPARESEKMSATIRTEQKTKPYWSNGETYKTLPVYFVEPVLDADLLLLANIAEAITTGGGLLATPCGAPVFDRRS